MKHFLKISLFAIISFPSWGQSLRTLPQVELKNLLGKTTITSDFDNDGKPIVLCFWATWCKPCITELSNYAEYYDEWRQETGVKLIAVSIDDARNQARVAPFVKGKGWDYEVYLDLNSDFKRAMNVNLIPHTFLLNGKKEIVWQHNSYTEGDEFKLLDLIKKSSSGQAIPD